MNSSVKIPQLTSTGAMTFFRIFFLVFSLTLVLLGTVQAILGTLRWYNPSEQLLENLQKYPIYSASELEPRSSIHVNIAPKTEKAEIYAFVPASQNPSFQIITSSNSTNDQVRLPSFQDSSNNVSMQPLTFQTPVTVSRVPLDAVVPDKFDETIDDVLTGTYFRDVLWGFPLIIDMYRMSPRGQMKDESITLSGRIKTLPETAKVLVHELGHMVDIYTLRKN
jgi:hypothetical protein